MGAQERARKARREQRPREEQAWRIGLQTREPVFHLTLEAAGLRPVDVEPSTPDYYDPAEWPPSDFWTGPSGVLYAWDPENEEFYPFLYDQGMPPPPGLIHRVIAALGEAGAWPEDVPVSDQYL